MVDIKKSKIRVASDEGIFSKVATVSRTPKGRYVAFDGKFYYFSPDGRFYMELGTDAGPKIKNLF